MSKAIETEALHKRFGALQAVDGVSFSVERGEVLGFLGPNGAGKTTTMRIVTGFVKPDSGRASVCGRDVLTDEVAAREAIGYLPEGAPLYADMTPEGFLDFVARRGACAGRGRASASAGRSSASICVRSSASRSKRCRRGSSAASASRWRLCMTRKC